MNSFGGISQYGAYANNISNTSTQSLSESTVDALKEGQVFEGSINSVDENGRVVIGLSNGQTLSARLDAGVSITEGQSLFFQVKSNDGSLIQIKPLSMDIGTNPTLLKALDSANIMATEKTVSMVNSLMQEAMPIDSESLSYMNRLILSNPNVSPDTLVQMTKYDIEVNADNVSMFEAYSTDSASIVSSSDKLSESISNIISEAVLSDKSEAINLNSSLNSIFEKFNSLDLGNETGLNTLVGTEKSDLFNDVAGGILATSNTVTSYENMGDVNSVVNPENIGYATEITTESTLEALGKNAEFFSNEGEIANSNILTTALSDKEISGLSNLLTSFEGFKEGNPKLFDENNNLRTDITSNELFSKISIYLNENSDIPLESLKNLFSGSSYKALLKNLMSNSYGLSPEDVAKPGKISETFERVLKLSADINQLFKDSPSKSADSLKAAVSEIRSNVNFMNSSNEIYNFIQIPLKMFKQNTQGTLYVRQNKKEAYENGQEITCYLHFDMENLGPTDIYIKLCKMNVNCDWHLADEASMDLIENNIGILENRLEKLGFNCTMSIDCLESKADFVEDFLKAEDTSSSLGLVHRYSFDMKA